MPDLAPHIDALHRLRPYRLVARAWSDPVALACSGGGDSLALMLLAARARRAGSVGPCVVLHVDHGVRSGSAAEQRTVARWAAALNLPFAGIRVDREKSAGKASPEEALRGLRYGALARAVKALGLSAIVTAHNSDDQVETMLLRLLHGASPLGLLGMATHVDLDTPDGRVAVRRPLLEATREELREVCRQAGLEPIEDPSNLDLEYRRNALRHRVVPVLREIEPGFDKALRRAAELAARDQEVVDQIARGSYVEIVEQCGDRLALRRAALTDLHPAVSSRIIRWAALELEPDLGRELPFERVEAVVRALDGRSGAHIELGHGLAARIMRDRVLIERIG